MTHKFIVYGLIDPRTGEVRYVGKSSSGMSRPRQHQNIKSRKLETKCGLWLRDLYQDNHQVPCIIVLAECSSNEMALAEEIRLIAIFRQAGFPLTNITSGGQGSMGRPASDKTKEAVRKAHLGKVYTPEQHARLRDLRKNQKPPVMTDESKARMVAKLTGRKQSDEVKAKKSLASKRLWASPGYKEKMSKTKKDKYQNDPEFRANVTKGLKLGWGNRKEKSA